MIRLQILCIEKDDRYNPDQRILRIGGKHANGTSWNFSLQEAIEGIESRKWSFVVIGKQLANGEQHLVDVIVSKSRLGNKYLKTSNDTDLQDNLLSLPECK